MKRAALQVYRLAVLVAIAWIIRGHEIRLRIEGHAPITVEEVRAVFPETAELRPDSGERADFSSTTKLASSLAMCCGLRPSRRA